MANIARGNAQCYSQVLHILYKGTSSALSISILHLHTYVYIKPILLIGINKGTGIINRFITLIKDYFFDKNVLIIPRFYNYSQPHYQSNFYHTANGFYQEFIIKEGRESIQLQ